MRRHDCQSYHACLDLAAHQNRDFSCPCSQYFPVKTRPTWGEVQGCLQLILMVSLPDCLMANLRCDPDAFADAVMRIKAPVDDSVEHQVFL